jgi:hypothetical protein
MAKNFDRIARRIELEANRDAADASCSMPTDRDRTSSDV